EKALKFRTLVIAALWLGFNREAAGRDVEAEDAVTHLLGRARPCAQPKIFFSTSCNLISCKLFSVRLPAVWTVRCHANTGGMRSRYCTCMIDSRWLGRPPFLTGTDD